MKADIVTEPGRILDACREIFAAPEPALVAVAFWGRGAIEELGVRRSAIGTRLIVNAESGCCHPQELRELLGMKNVSVRTLNRLHAKAYIGTSRMLVGSANASSNGLGFQGSELSGWREACTVVEGAEPVMTARLWFQARWSEGTDLSESIIRRAESAWEAARRRAHRLAKSSAQGKGEEISMSLDGAAIYVAITDENTDISQRDFDQALRARGIAPSDDLAWYQDWPSIPKDALLLAFGAEPDGSGLFTDGEWLTRFPVASLEVKGRKKAYPIVRAGAADRKDRGCPVTAQALKPAVREVLKTLKRRGAAKVFRSATGAQYASMADWCVPLYAFAEYCRAQGIELPAALD